MIVVNCIQKVLPWLKKYWQLVLLIAGTIASIVFFKARENSFSDELKKIDDVHKKELQDIEAAREEERRKNAEAEKRLSEALAAVQQQYDAAKQDLDEKKRKEIEDIVKQYAGDPEELARQLSAATGFSVVLPSD